MLATHLCEAKNVYTYEEIIGQEFLIHIPKGRIYTSPRERNGSKDQMFSSNDAPRKIIAKCFAVTKYSGDGICHPACYSDRNIVKDFEISGGLGCAYACDEFNAICRCLGGQDRVRDVRNISDEDIKMIGISEFDEQYFWVNTHYKKGYMNYVPYMRRGKYISCCPLLSIDGKGKYYENGSYGIRPVFILDVQVKLPEPKISWVFS